MTVVVAALAAIVALLLIAIYLRSLWRYATSRAAVGVVRALRGDPENSYTVQVHKWVPMVGAWNPSLPLRRNGQVFGDGTATYRLDSTDRVTLTWKPRAGEPHEYTGEIPSQIDIGHPDHRKHTAALRVAAIVYAVADASGFAIGYAVSSGAPIRRAGIGLVGVFVAMATIWVAVVAFSVAHSTRDVVHRRETRD